MVVINFVFDQKSENYEINLLKREDWTGTEWEIAKAAERVLDSFMKELGGEKHTYIDENGNHIKITGDRS